MPSHRLSLWLAGSCAAALALAVATPVAWACSCVGTQVVPDASGPVPSNVVFAVRTQAEWAESVTLRRGETLEPVDLEAVEADIETIELFAGQALVLIRPAEPLVSGGFYVSVDAISHDVGPYVTSSATVDDTVAVPAIATVRAEARDGDSVSSASCEAAPGGYYGTLRLELERAPANTAHALLQLRAGDAEPVQVPVTRSLDGDESLELDTGVCDPLPAIVPGKRYCAQLTVYDLGGNSATSNEVCTMAHERGCSTASGAGAGGAALLVALLAIMRRRTKLARSRST